MPSRYTLPIVLFSVLLAIVPARARADTIHFKNGSVLNNVIIMSQDWRGVQVRISDTVSMSFTRKDLDRIERERISTGSPPLRRPPSGVRVPSALQAKLTESIAVNYPDPTSFVEIFDGISKLYGVNITVDAKVQERIAGGSIDPLWTFTKEDGSNVFQMLAKLEEDKALTWQFSDNSILIGVSSQPVPAVAPMQPTVPAPAFGFPAVPVIPTPATAPGVQSAAPTQRGVPGAPAGRQRGGGRPSRGGPRRGPAGRRGRP